MDNEQQIEEIRKYLRQLTRSGKKVDENSAAFMWIKKYAEQWRNTRNSSTPSKKSCKNK